MLATAVDDARSAIWASWVSQAPAVRRSSVTSSRSLPPVVRLSVCTMNVPSTPTISPAMARLINNSTRVKPCLVARHRFAFRSEICMDTLPLWVTVAVSHWIPVITVEAETNADDATETSYPGGTFRGGV